MREIDLPRLRQALLSEPDQSRPVRESGFEGLAMTPAAVLFPIVVYPDRLAVLLTQRTDHLKDHPGQISFPGGRVEESDHSPLHTALRETEEEIGLDRSHVELLGYLPDYFTGTGFQVTPVVATVRPPYDLSLDPVEVAEAFEVPLGFLLDDRNHRRHSLFYRGAMRQFHAMPYGDYFIWGATAGMIRVLFDRLGAAG